MQRLPWEEEVLLRLPEAADVGADDRELEEEDTEEIQMEGEREQRLEGRQQEEEVHESENEYLAFLQPNESCWEELRRQGFQEELSDSEREASKLLDESVNDAWDTHLEHMLCMWLYQVLFDSIREETEGGKKDHSMPVEVGEKQEPIEWSAEASVVAAEVVA